MSPAGAAILRSTNTASHPCNGESLCEYVGLTMNELDRNDVTLSRFVMFWISRVRHESGSNSLGCSIWFVLL